MKKQFLVPFLTLLLLSVLINPAAAQNKGQAFDSSSAFQMMFQNSKINNPNSVLKNFVNGESKTRVIVILREPSTAKQLKNFKNIQVREQLTQTVQGAQKRVVSVLDSKNIRITNKFTYIFGFSAEVSPEGLMQLLDHPDVLSIEEDAILHAQVKQGITLMNAMAASGQYDGAGTSIAICDTGIDYTHPKLGNGEFPNTKVIGGWDCGDDDSNPMDSQGHGTACAGIAAGNLGSSGDYIGGVASGAKLYAVKISSGSTNGATTANMIEGWEWCITHQNDDPANPILVISTSFGGGQFFSESACDEESLAMTTAAANAVDAGITIFASSGNEGYCGSMGWPACISHVNSVGAVYDASFGTWGSCWDPDETCFDTEYHEYCDQFGLEIAWDVTAADSVTTYSNSASFLDFFAPSHLATTTKMGGGYWTGNDGFGGTSAACPYAAGAAASLQSANKAKQGVFLTPDQLKANLTSYGDPITDGKVNITKPRINLGDSVDSIETDPDLCQGDCLDLEDYNLSIWDFSGTYTSSHDGMTLTYTLIQDAKGKLTGSGTFDKNDVSIPVEIKGNVKGKNNIVTLKYKAKGKDALGNTVQADLKLVLTELTPVPIGIEKMKICQKGQGCIKTETIGATLEEVPAEMDGKAKLEIVAAPIDAKRKKLEGTGELTLSNGDSYNLYAKGKFNSKKNVTKYSLKGDTDETKAIKVKVTIDEVSGDTTYFNAKVLGQKLKYKLE